MPAFDTDFALADDLFAEAFGVPVTYARGSDTVSITAEVVLASYEATGPTGGQTRAQPRGYLVTVADLILSGSSITPRSGDKIRETILGIVEEFEVMPLGDRPCHEDADAGRTKWLVHTKYVGVAA